MTARPPSMTNSVNSSTSINGLIPVSVASPYSCLCENRLIRLVCFRTRCTDTPASYPLQHAPHRFSLCSPLVSAGTRNVNAALLEPKIDCLSLLHWCSAILTESTAIRTRTTRTYGNTNHDNCSLKPSLVINSIVYRHL